MIYEQQITTFNVNVLGQLYVLDCQRATKTFRSQEDPHSRSPEGGQMKGKASRKDPSTDLLW